jgi:hypothetical protein
MFSGRWLAAFVLSWALHCENKRPALIWSCALLLAVTSCAALDHRTPGDKRGTPGDKRGENVDERRRSGTAEGAPPVGVAPPLPDGHGETSVSYEPAEPPMPFTWPADVLMVRFEGRPRHAAAAVVGDDDDGERDPSPIASNMAHRPFCVYMELGLYAKSTAGGRSLRRRSSPAQQQQQQQQQQQPHGWATAGKPHAHAAAWRWAYVS